MKVLIGITTYNRADILAKSIESALAQDYVNKEVIIFDDASTDDTPQIQKIYPQVRWIREDTNRGCLYGRNLLMSETDADLYFSLDDDAWFVEENEITQGVEILQQNPNVAALSYDILSPDRPDLHPKSKPVPTHMYIGCGHLLRLSVAKELGYYTPNPGNYGGEEKDLCLRILDRGYEILHLPGIHVWHDKTNIARDLLAQHRSGVCNDLVFALRRSPSYILYWLIPAKILNHLKFAIFYRESNLMPAAIDGILKFIKSIPEVLPTRQPVSQEAFRKFQRRSQRFD